MSIAKQLTKSIALLLIFFMTTYLSVIVTQCTQSQSVGFCALFLIVLVWSIGLCYQTNAAKVKKDTAKLKRCAYLKAVFYSTAVIITVASPIVNIGNNHDTKLFISIMASCFAVLIGVDRVFAAISVIQKRD